MIKENPFFRSTSSYGVLLHQVLSILSILSIRSILSILSILSINAFALNIDKTNAVLYERITIRPEITNVYSNPFDSEEIKVDAEVISPSGKRWSVPGFYVQPYSGKLFKGKENIEKKGQPEWQIRLSFSKPGKHEIKITAKDKTGVRTLGTASLQITDHGLRTTDYTGFIRRHKTDHRYFSDENGAFFYPLGANICWSVGMPQGVFAYDYWLPKYKEQSCNYFRLFLSPAWCNFSLRSQNSGFYKFDQKNAWKIDHVLELAEKLNLRVMFAIDSFNSISKNKKFYGMFDSSPCNIKNGGPVEKPIDYFTNPKAQKANYNRLRYLVARYGYSPAVFAWELWNEVDGSGAFRSKNGPKIIAKWHAETAKDLRKLDPWHHLITTSLGHDKGHKLIEGIPEMDLIQIHHYDTSDLAASLGELWKQRRNNFKKPFFSGEFGCDATGMNSGDHGADPKGVHLHNGLFASAGNMCAGAPMVWYWDSYVEPNNLYPIYGNFANWISDFDFIKQKVKPIDAELEFIYPDEIRERETLTLIPMGRSWEPAGFNKPSNILIPNDEIFEPEIILSKLIHGANHTNLINPQTFVLDIATPAKFIINVGEVSGWGGAFMQISIDGKIVLEKDFKDPDGLKNKDLLKQYAGEYVVDIPAGKHKISINNTGQDWFEIKEYLIPNYIESKKPTLRVSGIIGKTKGLIWIQSPHYIWSKVYEKDFKPYIYKDVQLIVKNLLPGNWTVEEFNTQNGKVTSSKKIKIRQDGKLKINLPEISWDIAYRLQMN